eukprot:6873775-Prymnesium_polylepis.1
MFTVARRRLVDACPVRAASGASRPRRADELGSWFLPRAASCRPPRVDRCDAQSAKPRAGIMSKATGSDRRRAVAS